jgi:hypothetical protein
MARVPRSLFFSYEGRGGIVSDAKGKVTDVSFAGWKDGISIGKLKEVTCPKKTLGTSPIKYAAASFARALAPTLRLLPIPEARFVKFLMTEGAQDKSWTMRFWEVREDEEWSRAITAGKETPDVWENIVKAMVDAKRRTVWAGVEFTHPNLQTRVMIHRWPTAAIAPWGEGGSAYAEVKDHLLDLLKRIV